MILEKATFIALRIMAIFILYEFILGLENSAYYFISKPSDISQAATLNAMIALQILFLSLTLLMAAVLWFGAGKISAKILQNKASDESFKINPDDVSAAVLIATGFLILSFLTKDLAFLIVEFFSDTEFRLGETFHWASVLFNLILSFMLILNPRGILGAIRAFRKMGNENNKS